MRVELIKTLGDEMLAAMRRIVQPINERLALLDGARETHLLTLERHASETRAQSLQIEKLQSEIVLLRSAMQDIPAGQKGDPGKDGAPGLTGKDGRDGVDGKDGRDGVDGAPGPQGERGEQGPQGAPGIDGKDGAHGINGEKGEKGDPGADGRSITMEDVQPVLDVAVSKALLDLERKAEYVIQKAADRLPKPKDGAPGRDAFDLADLFIEHDGERTATIGFRRGAEVVSKELRLPVVIDRGVWKVDRQYEDGDGVTYGGDYWIAKSIAQAGEKPGESEAWRLAVRKGRDGRR